MRKSDLRSLANLGVQVRNAIGDIDSLLNEERSGIELKRRGHAAEVAGVVAFLCSERASFVNETNYWVDSGTVAAV